MAHFDLDSITLHLGYDCSSLSPSAHALESSYEFKRAAEVDFDRHFDVWLQDRSFTTPYAGRITPTTVPTPNAFGDVDPQQVLDLTQEHLQSHARTAAVDGVAAATGSCVWNPILKKWVTIGGFTIELDGQPYTASAATADFEAAYRANRPSIPANFDEDLDAIRDLPATAFVQWWV